MEKKNLEWGNLGFEYHVTDMRYVSDYKDGKWDEGRLTADATIPMSECAGIMQYCQQVFEGLKAYTTKDGHINTFRPDLNADRIRESAMRIEMPPFLMSSESSLLRAISSASSEHRSALTLREALSLSPCVSVILTAPRRTEPAW